MYETSGDRDQTACFAASDLGLHCLPIAHIKDAGLYILSVRLQATMVYILQTFVTILFWCKLAHHMHELSKPIGIVKISPPATSIGVN